MDKSKALTWTELRVGLVTGWEPGAEALSEAHETVEAVFRKPLDLPALRTFLGEPTPSTAD